MRATTSIAGALAALVLVTTGCSITPFEEVESPNAEPATLAFSDEPVADTARPTPPPGEPGQRTADALLLESREPGGWTVATSDARLGVHSAPDYVYTRVGVLDPGTNVISTGRRAATDSVNWMEIRWGDATAWVVEAGFAPLE